MSEAADFLFAERQARRRYVNLPDALRPADEAAAYAAQEALVARLGPVGGYKIALTSPAMQRLVNLHRPCGGQVLAAQVRRTPARLRAADHFHFGVECEVALRLGAALGPAAQPWTAASVAPNVAAAMAAFELVDDRGANYGGLDALSLIADNAWNAGAVLGPETAGCPAGQIAAAEGVLEIDGREAGRGRVADAALGPLEALAWLANLMAAHGRSMAAGAVVLTGSVIATRFLEAGQRARFSLGGLGAVEIEVC